MKTCGLSSLNIFKMNRTSLFLQFRGMCGSFHLEGFKIYMDGGWAWEAETSLVFIVRFRIAWAT